MKRRLSKRAGRRTRPREEALIECESAAPVDGAALSPGRGRGSVLALTSAERAVAELVTDLSRHPQWSKLKPRLANKSREQVIDLLAQAFAGATTAADAMKRDLLAAIR